LKIAILTANNFTDATWTDPRVYKQGQALLQAGHEVVVLGTGKYGLNPRREEVKDGMQVIRRPTLMHRLYALISPSARSNQQGTQKRNIYYFNRETTGGLKDRLLVHLLQLAHDLNTLLFALAILPTAVHQRADVYIGRGLEGLFPAYLAARLTGARLAYDSLEWWTERERYLPYGPWHKAAVSWVEKMICGRCDLVIVVTPTIARILAERYAIPEPVVIPNAYHSSIDVTPSPELRAELGGSPGQKIVIYVGFLQPGKGLEQLIDAAQYLNGVVIAIVGDGVLRPVLEARAREKNVADRVRFVGWVKSADLPRYIASADLGITPMQRHCLNYYYNVDYKPFHYIAAGIPLAVSDHPEKRRLVEERGIGAAFDERDPRDIARVITRLLSDPAEYEAMRARCQKVGREELNWEVISKRFVAAIEHLK